MAYQLSAEQRTAFVEGLIGAVAVKSYNDPDRSTLCLSVPNRVRDEIKKFTNIHDQIFLRIGETEQITDFIEKGGMVYGSNPPLDNHYYLDIIHVEHADCYRLFIKYQFILGSRFVCDISHEEMDRIVAKMRDIVEFECSPEGIEQRKTKPRKTETDRAFDKMVARAASQKVKLPVAGSRDPAIERVIPTLKGVEYTNDDCTELKLPGQLDAKDYQLVKKMFEDMGGKWHRGSGTHRFEESPIDRITEIIETGVFQKTDKMGYFPTPVAVAENAIQYLDYTPGMRILEPEIGQGHFADVIKRMYPEAVIDGFEVNPKNHAVASAKHNCKLADFMDQEPEPVYDAVIMNPPFEKQQDIKHVEHAMKFLRPGGQLIAIMSPSFTFRQDARSKAFREMLEDHGFEMVENGAGAFRESGTMINTVTIQLKAKRAPRPRM